MRKVMRGGGAVTLIYKNTKGTSDKTVGGPWTFFKLEFDKNKFSNCYTLKLTFDLNNMILNVITYNPYRGRDDRIHRRSPDITRFSIPSIIDSIFYSIFDYDYIVTTSFNSITIKRNPDSKWFDYEEDEDGESIRDKLFNLATNAINGHWENVQSKKTFGQIMDDDERFKNNCVVELEFCPSDNNTTVQLKKYPDIKKGWRGYWEWETISPKEKFITVNKKLDVQRIEALKKSTEFYLFLPNMNRSDKPFENQFYWFDKQKLDEHIRVINETSKRQYEDLERQQERKKAEEKAAAEAKAAAEKERRDKMTPEEREAEDKGKAEAEAKAAAEAYERWRSTPGSDDWQY